VTAVRTPEAKVRRSRHLVLYWDRGRLVVHNYATGHRSHGEALLCSLLEFCREWRDREQIQTFLGVANAGRVRALIRRLVTRSFLDRSDRPLDPRIVAMSALDRWNPEAGFFHTATKDVSFWSPLEAARQARAQAKASPMPPPAKRYRGAKVVGLPQPQSGVFPDVLRKRRTWRRFSKSPVRLDELSTVLGLAVGVQQWVRSGGGDLPLKTSPSGGARHPVECYVVARHVRGLEAGVYHYAADRHVLERLRGPVSPERIASYYPSSTYFAKASAHVFLTAVFARQLWRYPYSRAYRAALAEAGHVCQTFCLTSTWLGLAPFCLMGLADSLIEQDLGLDGISESVLYAAGVGRPPRGSTWAPLGPRTRGNLRARPNRPFNP
jgi:SagB-type dehydrogenase family enzyme